MQRDSNFIARRQLIALPCSIVVAASVGCMTPWLKRPDPNSPEARQTRRDEIKAALASEDRPRLINEIASSRLITLSRIENLGLVTQLEGTGGAVEASDQRERMLDMMRRRDVSNPNMLLDDLDTAMVVVFVNVPPAARRGSVHNAGVRLSSHAEGSSLQAGWLMRTELAEVRSLDGKIREGFDFAAAEGPIVTEAQVTGNKERDAQITGFVVGGARLFKDRPLGIGFNEEFADAVTQAAVLPAINDRFTVFDGQKKGGIATPKSDQYIELDVPQRYLKDPFHFVNVVLNLGFAESPTKRAERMELCRKQLLEPTTARAAAWQLEAIGKEAIPALSDALVHPDPEVRFYAAHSLAYLGEPRCISVLKQLAPQQAAFRAMCYTALSTIDHPEAEDALSELLHASDAETRYGALIALRSRDPNNPLVNGVQIGKHSYILQIPSNAPPLIAVSLESKAEIVIFGPTPRLTLPGAMQINSRIMLKLEPNNTVTISRFAPDEEDRIAHGTTELPSILAAITEVGGGYGDWVSFIRQCSEQGYLTEPIAMNPVPSAGRVYDREKKQSVDAREPGEALSDIPFTAEKPEEPKSTVTWYNPMTWWNQPAPAK